MEALAAFTEISRNAHMTENDHKFDGTSQYNESTAGRIFPRS